MANTPDFRTTDTALAAYLVVHGMMLKDLDITDHPVQYVFSNSNGKLNLLITAWESSEAPEVAFYRQYRKFIDIVKRGR